MVLTRAVVRDTHPQDRAAAMIGYVTMGMAVVPMLGPVLGGSLDELLADPAARARRLVHVPMGRLAEAEEVARAALFLASDEARFITAVVLPVDGGYTVTKAVGGSPFADA